MKIKLFAQVTLLSLFLSGVLSSQASTVEAPLVSIATHDSFFESLRQHCGKAYQGKVTVDNVAGDSFANKNLIMHIQSIT